ncbi:hypothetical protein [Pseudomonas amygdali]|nr:hypothetical protein [Pseudomonas amygdali]
MRPPLLEEQRSPVVEMKYVGDSSNNHLPKSWAVNAVYQKTN